MPQCAIIDCSLKTGLKSVPGGNLDDTRRKNWLQYCRKGTEKLKRAHVCSIHFSSNQFYYVPGKQHKYLKHDAVPDQHLPDSSSGDHELPVTEELDAPGTPAASISHSEETLPTRDTVPTHPPMGSLQGKRPRPQATGGRIKTSGTLSSKISSMRKRRLVHLTPFTTARRIRSLSAARNARRVYLSPKGHTRLQKVRRLMACTSSVAIRLLCDMYLGTAHTKAAVRSSPVTAVPAELNQSIPVRRPPASTTSADELPSACEHRALVKQEEQADDLPPGGVAVKEEVLSDSELPSVEAGDRPGSNGRRPVRSAAMTDSCLESLLQVSLVRCRCGRTCLPGMDRVNTSVVVKWTCSTCGVTRLRLHFEAKKKKTEIVHTKFNRQDSAAEELSRFRINLTGASGPGPELERRQRPRT